MTSNQAHIKRSAGTLRGAEGKTMDYNLHRPKGSQALPLVVYAHGLNGFKDWGGMERIADAFAKAGFLFLRFNFSHNGTSPEAPTEIKDEEAYAQDSYLKRQTDLAQVIGFVLEHHQELGVDWQKIFLIGHSRGGTDAILYAATDERIKKLVTWSAPAHVQSPWKSFDEEEMEQWRAKGHFHLDNKRTGQSLPIAYSLYKEYQQNKEEALNLEEKARGLHQNWLIVHGEEDEAVFVKDAYTLKSWQAQAEVSIISGAGHTFGRRHPYPETLALPATTLVLVEKTIAFLGKEASLWGH